QIKQDNFYGIFIINHLEPATEICKLFDNPKNLIFIGNYDNKDIRQVSINLKSLKSKFGESAFIIKDEFGIGFYSNSIIIILLMNKIKQIKFVNFSIIQKTLF